MVDGTGCSLARRGARGGSLRGGAFVTLKHCPSMEMPSLLVRVASLSPSLTLTTGCTSSNHAACGWAVALRDAVRARPVAAVTLAAPDSDDDLYPAGLDWVEPLLVRGEVVTNS